MKTIQKFLWGLIALAVLGIGISAIKMPNKQTITTQHIISPNSINWNFSLISHKGKTITDKDFPEQWRLVFFGFTYCPEVCPLTMTKITEIMNELGPLTERIQPLFISIDPQRDTPERLAEYLDHFHSKIIGLTGSNEEIKAVTDNFKAYYFKPDNSSEDYVVDHSSSMYLFNTRGDLEELYSFDKNIKEIELSLKGYLSE